MSPGGPTQKVTRFRAVLATSSRNRPDLNRRKDCDNLHKPIGDACTAAGIYKDDSLIVDLHLCKHFVRRGEGRVVIQIDIKE